MVYNTRLSETGGEGGGGVLHALRTLNTTYREKITLARRQVADSI